MSEKMIELRRQQMGQSAVPSALYPTQQNKIQARPGGMAMGNMNTNLSTNGVGTPYRSVPTQGQNQILKPTAQTPPPTPMSIVTAQDKNLESFLNLLSYSSNNITPQPHPDTIRTSLGISASTNATSNQAQSTIPQHNKITTSNQTPLSKSLPTPKKVPKSLPPPPAPTVPTSLTRRILQTQGCSFLDPNIATIMSHAADHFLATVLSQALACRDLRIQGEDLRKQAYRNEKLERRKRKQAWVDRVESKKKKIMIKEGRWKEDIEKARKLKEEQERMLMDGSNSLGGANSASGRSGKSKGGNSKRKSSGGSSKKKNQTKQVTLETGNNGDNVKNVNEKIEEVEEDEISMDSLEAADLDDDAFYYGDDLELSSDEDNDDDDEDDEDRDILLLKDVERPVQAWGMTFAGKCGLSSSNFFQESHTNDAFTHSGDDERVDEKDGDGNIIGSSSGEGTSSSKNNNKSMQSTSASSKSKVGSDGASKKATETKKSSSASTKKNGDK